MRLSTLAQAVAGADLSGGGDPDIAALCYDSREARGGSLFFALRGELADGHDFIPAAVEKGASGLVVEEVGERGTPTVRVRDSRAALSAMADVFFGRPSLSMKVAGITGTNGKTTTALILHSLLNEAQRRCGLLGTVHYDLGGQIERSERTTPESSDIHQYLARMLDRGCRAAVMEVSSHGLAQGRTADVAFDVAIFTNLSHDHLDYHGDMASYFASKRLLFEQVARGTEKGGTTAVVNADDAWGRKLVDRFPDGSAKLVTYGMGLGCDYRAADLRQSREGIEFTLEVKGRQLRARIPLIGRFNVYNSLAALAGGVAMGLNLREAVANLASLPQVPGRLESVSEGRAFHVFVDYAHTPDALENALETLRELDPRRLVLVFGCGGNRDIPKRAKMGEVASRLADHTVITSDNPRSEDPGKIIKDIEGGFSRGSFDSVPDRREAIWHAVSMLMPGDVLLVAGKGHEDYQQFADRTIEFDDRVVTRQLLSDRDGVRHEEVMERRREIAERERGRGRDRETEGEGAPDAEL